MSEFTCPTCKAKNRPSPGQVGCMACGQGRPKHVEHKPLPQEPQQTEVQPPPGYTGKLLNESA